MWRWWVNYSCNNFACNSTNWELDRDGQPRHRALQPHCHLAAQWQGAGGGGWTGSSVLASSELYDPATGNWTATGSLATARGDHSATLLINGKVMVAGGYGVYVGGTSLAASSELYDPATGIWTATAGSLATMRRGHTATLLPNGKVLVAGGNSDGSGINELASAELYDPVTGLWTTTGSLATARKWHTATLLPNGKVLVSKGQVSAGSSTAYPSSTELYDPATGLWTTTGSLTGASDHDPTATLLPNGKVLVAGGVYSYSNVSAELYDPTTGTWIATSNLANTRNGHSATLLSSGKVLVSGGFSAYCYYTCPYNSAELYDPATGIWAAAGSLATARGSHTATLLTNGKVLVAGGWTGSSALASSELYQ